MSHLSRPAPGDRAERRGMGLGRVAKERSHLSSDVRRYARRKKNHGGKIGDKVSIPKKEFIVVCRGGKT